MEVKLVFREYFFNAYSYGVSKDTETIDYDKVMEIAKECRPNLIIAGASSYSREIDFKKFRQIADEVSAYLYVTLLIRQVLLLQVFIILLLMLHILLQVLLIRL